VRYVMRSIAIVCLGLFALHAGPAHAEKRLALLIGNQAYTSEIGPLANPHNDVALLETAIERLGFEVWTVRDAGFVDMHQALNAHVRRLRQGGADAVGLLYYAGHGASDSGTNYLIPVDVRSPEEGDLWDRSLRVSEIARKLRTEAGSARHFVVLDACRNNLKLRKAGSKALLQSRGLVRVDDAAGMLIAYATAEGELASDVGAGAGPYARALAEEIVKPGVEAVTMFRNVQRRVRSAIGQEPHLQFSALGDVYLAGPPVHQPSDAEAARVCREVEGMSSLSMLGVLADRHKGTLAGKCIDARMAQLKGVDAAKTKAEAEARTEAAEAERRRLALQQQRVEAEAARKRADAADAARKKVEEEPRTKVEAERLPLQGLPVKLSPKDLELLSNFDAIRRQAIAKALASGESTDREELAKALVGDPQPISDGELLGKWRCRSIQMADLGIFAYPFFDCRVLVEQGKLVFWKTGGSQRTKGHLFRMTGARFAYVGSAYYPYADATMRPYGAKAEHDQVAILVKVARNRLRLEFPEVSGFEIMELVR